MVAIITAVVLFLCVPVGAVIYTILTFDIMSVSVQFLVRVKKRLLWWNRSDLISEVCFAFGLSKKNQNMN